MPNQKIINLRGEQGTLVSINTTQTAEGGAQWAQFVVIAEATITNIVMPKEEGDVSAYYGLAFPQGFIFDGPITSITHTGVIRLYNYIDPRNAAARKLP